jgi:hypothetical protein
MKRHLKRHVSAPGPLNAPQPVRVQASVRGRPIVVAGKPVKTVDNDWLGEDGWWLEDELHRRYYQVTTVAGRDVVVFRDLDAGGWFEQRA